MRHEFEIDSIVTDISGSLTPIPFDLLFCVSLCSIYHCDSQFARERKKRTIQQYAQANKHTHTGQQGIHLGKQIDFNQKCNLTLCVLFARAMHNFSLIFSCLFFIWYQECIFVLCSYCLKFVCMFKMQ